MATPDSTGAAKVYPVLHRREVEGMIAAGRHIIVYDHYALKVDAWLPYHPGGDKSIKHMVGRDATDEINALHSKESQDMMQRYRIGRIQGRWTNFVPPIQGGVFRKGGKDWSSEEEEEEIQIDDLATPADSLISSLGSSSSSSRSGSPIFDEEEASTLRKRRSGGTSTTYTSVDEQEGAGMGLLDRLTMEELQADSAKYPALDSATQEDIIEKYRSLNERIKAEGLYQCNYGAYAVECCRYIALFGAFLLMLKWEQWALSGLFLGAFWHQLVFTAHDAGHMGITHSFHVDTVIGIIIADFLGGLSIGWWKRNHNVHHIVTNSPEHDPDIEHMPFFAISHRFLTSLRSSYYDRVMEYDAVAKVALRVQHMSYYILMMFGRFNLYRLSWEYLLGKQAPRRGPAWWHRYLELAGQVCFWTWFGYAVLYRSIPSVSGRVVLVLVSHMATAILHVQITLSHFAMSTTEMGPDESFPQKMLRTTMDVECPQWLDFFHGGLQFQAIHHLYPRIPRHNLRRTQKLVQQFCEEVKIPYALYGFVDGNKAVISRLADVSRQAAILAKCQQVLMESGDPSHATHR